MKKYVDGKYIELTAEEYIKNDISIDMAAGGGFLVKITGHYAR